MPQKSKKTETRNFADIDTDTVKKYLCRMRDLKITPISGFLMTRQLHIAGPWIASMMASGYIDKVGEPRKPHYIMTEKGQTLIAVRRAA